MKQKNENYWLLDAPVTKAIWHMAIPMMLGMSVNIIYNITDTFFIGKLMKIHILYSYPILMIPILFVLCLVIVEIALRIPFVSRFFKL